MWTLYDIHPLHAPAGKHEPLRLSLWTWRQQHMLSVRSSSEGIQDYQYSECMWVGKLSNYFVSWWFLLTRELYKSFFCCTEISSTTQATELRDMGTGQDRGAVTFTAVLCSVCPPALSWLTKNEHNSVAKARTWARQEWSWPGSVERIAEKAGNKGWFVNCTGWTACSVRTSRTDSNVITRGCTKYWRAVKVGIRSVL